MKIIKLAHNVVTVALCFALCGTSRSADDPANADRDERLAFMEQELDSYKMFRNGEADEPLSHTEKPVLRYSNPVRNFFSDGVLYFWLDGDRPVAATSISIRGNGKVAREFASFGKVTLKCMREGRTIWSPRSGGVTDQALADGPKAAPTPELRLTQMRQIARRFSADGLQPSDKQYATLRLLPQPIFRWSSGGVDGALFAFVLTNDPEVLLMIEADGTDKAARPSWRYSIARLSAPPARVKLDDKQIWSTEGYWINPRSIDDPYSETFGGTYAKLAESEDSKGAE